MVTCLCGSQGTRLSKTYSSTNPNHESNSQPTTPAKPGGISDSDRQFVLEAARGEWRKQNLGQLAAEASSWQRC